MATGGQDQVDNASGQPSAYTELRPRDREITPPPPARALRHRRHVQIDAKTSGPALGRFTEQSAATAARHLSVKETAARAGTGPLEQEYLDHVFGLNIRPCCDQA